MSYEETYEETERRVGERWGEKLSKPQLRTKIHFEDSLRKLIDICMTCPPEERPSNIHILYWSLPQSWRDNELHTAVEECQEEFEYSMPVMNCGVPVRSDILPELKETVIETDWDMLFNAILNCCNRRGLLIAQAKREVIPV